MGLSDGNRRPWLLAVALAVQVVVLALWLADHLPGLLGTAMSVAVWSISFGADRLFHEADD